MDPLELWAGPECSVVRVGDAYVDQVERTGFAERADDVDRLAALGARAVRFPVLWERTAPGDLADADWSFADARLARLRELGVRPIVGLVHHGSGPRWTSLVDPAFPEALARFARAVAERYPWVRDFTPVNEPLTTARFSALYGHWYPHARDARSFVRALLGQCHATRAAMRAIREITPNARLVQTEDVGTTFATPRLRYQADFENHRRFVTLDLLSGRVDRAHPLRGYLVEWGGASERELDETEAAPCPPDVIGVNYYVTSDRWLDERCERYPAHARGGNGRDAYADVEAVRARAEGIVGHGELLRQIWERYRRPVAVTEAHLGGAPEQQVRWLRDAWRGAEDARRAGADVRAVTVWAAFGSYDWDSLLLSSRGNYEPGTFDARGGRVRPTALAVVARELGARGESAHPALDGDGWWTLPARVAYPLDGRAAHPPPRRAAPVLVTGARGTLGSAFARACEERGIPAVTLARAELDVTDARAVREALARVRPWAVVNAAGYVRVDDAEDDAARCWRDNAHGAAVLAEACARAKIALATFSSDLVFDGAKAAPYVERDLPAPLGAYGRAKADAERMVLERHAGALVVRTSAFFGPWDAANFVTRALADLRAMRRVRAASDIVVSPTYVPDLAHAALTLLVDGADGVWHLASRGALSWAELARRAAERAGVSARALDPCPLARLAPRARRPAFSALASERGELMPTLDSALDRYVASLG